MALGYAPGRLPEDRWHQTGVAAPLRFGRQAKRLELLVWLPLRSVHGAWAADWGPGQHIQIPGDHEPTSSGGMGLKWSRLEPFCVFAGYKSSRDARQPRPHRLLQFLHHCLDPAF